MTIHDLLPWIAAAGFLAFTLFFAFKESTAPRNIWLFPAALSGLFLAFSIYAVFTGGILGFWTDHVSGAWGNQIWFDLLLAIGIGWFLIVPQAKAVGMRLLPWLALIVCSGCIGLLAMVARLLYLRERRAAAASRAQ